MCIFFSGVLTGRILLARRSGLGVFAWEVFVRRGPVAGRARGSEELLAAARPGAIGLIYGDPWLLPLLLPASLAFCSLFVPFAARGVGPSRGEEPARPPACLL